MAKQSSFIKLEGTIGDVTFYKGQNGFIARQKGGVSKTRIMNDAAYQRTRENLAEFAQAASAAKLLKDAFREITLRARDIRTHNRIYSQALKVLKTDLVSDRGERKVENGDTSLFVGFQFSSNSIMEATVYAQYGIQSDGADVIVTFDPFVPAKYLASPQGATDFRIFLVGAAAGFISGESSTSMVSSPVHKIDIDPLDDLVLTLPKQTGTDTHQFYALGIEYLQEVNGKLYTLNNGAHNAAKMILTETA